MSDAITEFTKAGLPFDAAVALKETLGKAEGFVAEQLAKNQNIEANQDFALAHAALQEAVRAIGTIEKSLSRAKAELEQAVEKAAGGGTTVRAESYQLDWPDRRRVKVIDDKDEVLDALAEVLREREGSFAVRIIAGPGLDGPAAIFGLSDQASHSWFLHPNRGYAYDPAVEAPAHPQHWDQGIAGIPTLVEEWKHRLTQATARALAVAFVAGEVPNVQWGLRAP